MFHVDTRINRGEELPAHRSAQAWIHYIIAHLGQWLHSLSWIAVHVLPVVCRMVGRPIVRGRSLLRQWGTEWIVGRLQRGDL